LSIDNGSNWFWKDDSLQNLSVGLLAMNSNTIYATTNFGIWKRPLTEMTAGIEDIYTNTASISLYPNPTTGKITISTN
jgi:hypothetical protein